MISVKTIFPNARIVEWAIQPDGYILVTYEVAHGEIKMTLWELIAPPTNNFSVDKLHLQFKIFLN